MARGGFDGVGSDTSHAAVIRGAATQKTRTAVRFILDDAAARRDGGGAERVGGAEDRYDREADRRGDMHGAGVVADE